ncbi:MAG: hypothetical protein ACRC0V_13055 [Fusobacteriaceae bacterium]
MKNSISIYDFKFQKSGYGHYKVTYISPITRKEWTITTDNMPLVDATKGENEPKKKDLIYLKKLCKNG